MSINIEEIIGLIVKEVLTELNKKGIEIDISPGYEYLLKKPEVSKIKRRIELEIKGYKTPILTEERLETVEPGINEIIVPEGTLLTPGAREIIKRRKLTVINK